MEGAVGVAVAADSVEAGVGRSAAAGPAVAGRKMGEL